MHTMQLKRRIPWFCLLLVILVIGCNISEPSLLDRPPMVKNFSPDEVELTAFIGDSLLFSMLASDPDGKEIRQYFLMGDSLVAEGSEWVYVVLDTGLVSITGVATDGQWPQKICWEVDRFKPNNLKPVIKSFEPPHSDPIVIIGNQLDFWIQAEDPEGKPLSYYYMIENEVVTMGWRYSFVATEVGDFVVTAVVFDGEKYNSKNWTVHVSEVPDLIPPAPVEIVSLETGNAPGELIVQWIAVGADSMDGVPSYYRLRTSTAEIATEENWDQGSDRPGEPTPASPGEIQTMIVADLYPAEFVYVAVRAVDEFGNMSDLSASHGEWSKGNEVYGRILNTVTGEPVEGIRIWFEGLPNAETFTDAQGWFAFTELPKYEGGQIIVDDDEDPYSYGDYFRFKKPYSVKHGDSLYHAVIPNITLDTSIYPDFLNFFKHMTDTFNHPFGNFLRTWDIPVDIYVTPRSINGLDYEATVIGILDEYETITGMDLFSLVSSPPDLGIEVIYSDPNRDEYSVLEWSAGDHMPVRGRITFRSSYSAATLGPFQKVIRHEVGHSLGMKHSLDSNHIMYGSVGIIPAVIYVTPDELALLKSMYRLPQGIPMALFLAD